MGEPVPQDIARHFPPPGRPDGVWRGTIDAAVLTYNRKELLKLCLDSLRDQIERPDRVIIVDNGSTDGTGQFLKDAGYLDDPLFRYVRLEPNIGAAPGFERLFQEVWRSGGDWGWFMDDDVVAAPGALRELKRAFAENFEREDDVGFLISSAVTPDGKANDVPVVDERRKLGHSAEWGDYLAAGLVKVRTSALNSILIPRTTLAAFGAPCLDFKVWGEDSDYCLRVTEERPGFIVGRSRIVHIRGVSGDLSIFTEPDGPRLERFYYLYRNTMYLRRRFWPWHAYWLFVAKSIGHFVRCLVCRDRPLHRAGLVLRGLVAGFFFKPDYVPLERRVSLDGRDGPAGSTAPGRAAPAA